MGFGQSKEQLKELKEYEAKWPEIRAEIVKKYEEAMPDVIRFMEKHITKSCTKNISEHGMTIQLSLLHPSIYGPIELIMIQRLEKAQRLSETDLFDLGLIEGKRKFLGWSCFRNGWVDIYQVIPDLPHLLSYDLQAKYNKNTNFKKWLEDKMDDKDLQAIIQQPIIEWFTQKTTKHLEEKKLKEQFEQEQFEEWKRKKKEAEYTAVLPKPEQQEPRELAEGEVEGKPNIEGH